MKPNLLLIDDDPGLLTALELLLLDLGMEVRTARSGEAGLALLREEPVDLVLSDVRMPGLTGLDVLREARRLDPHVPVVLLTGHATVEAAVEAIQQGAFDYLMKPAGENLGELERKLRVVITRALESSRLQFENARLRARLRDLGETGSEFLAAGETMQTVLSTLRRVARTDTTVLITGETGTGKEVAARTLHLYSARAEKPFVAVNCAALSESLLESELFGHEKGAFTGAVTSRRGRFEEADDGTLFLDEIGETSREFQASLLRVLQEKEFERVGSSRKQIARARVVASTNRDLAEDVREGRFREDLFYRLRVVPIHLPPLRERREDILPLARYFLDRSVEHSGSPARALSPAANTFLQNLPLPGNVRELENLIERAVILADQDVLDVEDLRIDERPGKPAADGGTLQDALDERTAEVLRRALDDAGWHRQQAANRLGMDRATLYRLLKKHGITQPDGAPGAAS